MKNDKFVATTILKQIGHKALFMLGATGKPIVALPNGVIFKVGRNSKRINKIKILLNGMDTYDIEFWYNAFSLKEYKDKSKLISTSEGVYFDQLRTSIETHTGLYTSL